MESLEQVYTATGFLAMHHHKLLSWKIAMVHLLDGYYSFKLYHVQYALYLLLKFWCLGAFCFMIALFMEMCLFKPL
jgi:hypothetical protein